jgi:hypothetical protein
MKMKLRKSRKTENKGGKVQRRRKQWRKMKLKKGKEQGQDRGERE